MFKGTKLILALLVAGSAFQACNSNKPAEFTTTESGLQYRYITQGEGPKAEDGQYLILNMQWRDSKDSLWFDTNDKGMPMPIPMKGDTLVNPAGIEEAFNFLKKGDSLEVKVLADNLFEKTFGVEMPEGIEKGSFIKFNIGVVDIKSEEDTKAWYTAQMEKVQAKMAKEAEGLLVTDGETIDKFLAEKHPDAKVQKTESGLRYIVTEEGKGENPQAGNSVKVHYKGTLLDGKMFDSSYERGEPIEFALGQGMVIPGWDEGISLLKKGGKATFYIPSPLAYGPQERGVLIKPNTILVFDVELVDFKN